MDVIVRNRMELAQDGDNWRTLVNMALNLQVTMIKGLAN